MADARVAFLHVCIVIGLRIATARLQSTVPAAALQARPYYGWNEGMLMIFMYLIISEGTQICSSAS